MEPNWPVLVRKWMPMVFTTAWRILGHRADAEDVAQEVFTQALQHWSDRSIQHWGGWFKRVATHRAIDRLRQRRTTAPVDDLEPIAPDAPANERLEQQELADRLRAVLVQLTDHEANIFCLRYFDELSYDEIAKLLQMESSAVGMALVRARSKLTDKLHTLWKELQS